MNILDIQNRLRQLNAQKFLSDDEVEEKEQLLEELAILRNNSRKPKDIENRIVKAVLQPKREHTVVGKAISKGLKGIIDHFKEKPVTLEELQQLKLQSMKYKLKADIAKSKRIIRGTNGNVLGSSGPKRKTSRTPRDTTEDVSRVLRGAVKTKDMNFWKKSSSNDIRKTFYG